MTRSDIAFGKGRLDPEVDGEVEASLAASTDGRTISDDARDDGSESASHCRLASWPGSTSGARQTGRHQIAVSERRTGFAAVVDPRYEGGEVATTFGSVEFGWRRRGPVGQGRAQDRPDHRLPFL
jgi:hypothetical protein